MSAATRKPAASSAKTSKNLPDQPSVAESTSIHFKQSILRHLTSTLARDRVTAVPRDWWIATAMATRDAILARLIATQRVHNEQNVRRLYYLSLEYLMGRLLENNLYNTDLMDAAIS